MLRRCELAGDRIPGVPPAHRVPRGRFVEKQITIRMTMEFVEWTGLRWSVWVLDEGHAPHRSNSVPLTLVTSESGEITSVWPVGCPMNGVHLITCIELLSR
jgi:hypothetical protein